ncbi:lysosomal acid glucosylceramidase-like [Diachasmimorpha longicaudata]|uniref:lysosomal acid glucosylceramidase-like n=1 Tax=Diachasmimorpha longicaudata TaxID=58733 RepID=UPI0030B8C87E
MQNSALFIIAYLLVQGQAKECVPRKFNGENIVCVCNSTYCDSVEVNALEKGGFASYLSSKSGARLTLEEGAFNPGESNVIQLKLNFQKTYQKILGFGGAFTDSVGINMKTLSEGSQEQLIRTYFSPEGSRYNLARLPIGGVDFSTRPYTLDDTPGDVNLSKFSLAQEDYEYKIPYMKRALAINAELKFLSAAWTAPPWMKTNNDYFGFIGRLNEDYYQTYADYLVKFLESYMDIGLPIWAISTGNEPESGFHPTQKFNNMPWLPQSVATWVTNNLGPAIEASNSNETIIIALDGQRFSLPWWVDNMYRANPDVDKYIAGVGVHWYSDAETPPNVLDEMHNISPKTFLLMTEACVETSRSGPVVDHLGSWNRGAQYMQSIMEYMHHWTVGWVDWNLALNKQGGPNWVGNFVDAPIIINPETDEFFKQPMYYALTHFSKFVPRGSIRISVGPHDDIGSVAFVTPNNTVVIILHNSKNIEQLVTIVDPDQGNINVKMPENSFRTILFKK